MVYPLLLSSTLLRTQRSHIPQSFCRFKSITAAIERGRQGGPDRPSRPRTRSPPEHVGEDRAKNRRELRLERFGPASDGSQKTTREERPHRDGGERVRTPRSSRFGRVGPPRSREFAPSRFQGDQEEKPSRDREERPSRNWEERSPRNKDEFTGRREDRVGSPQERTMGRGNRFDSERKPSSDRFEGRDRSGYRAEDREPRRERYEQREDRPRRQERQFETRDRKSFDRGDRFNGSPSTYSDRAAARGSRREAFGQGEHESRSERPERPFKDRDEPSSYTRERPARGQFEHRETSGKQPEVPTRTSGKADPQRSSVREPESLPYTTAASEFIYGYSSVLAAMKANRRKLYNLYVHSRGASRDGLLARIRALKMFPITQEVGDEYLRAMDKASSGRPHNGVILESSPLPVPPITELKAASFEDESFSVTIDSQSTEDALVNGKQELYSYKSAGWRHPLILYVDGVLDEGNLGAIARSAYFLGVDAIITPTRQIAPWSHIALKASAGAAEAIPLFKVGEPSDFLGKSSRAGWRIYASDAIPPPSSTTPEVEDESSSNIVYTFARSTKRLPADHCPVADHPTILMMGAEGAGLRDGLLNLAHYKVGIRHGRDVDEIGVDSLNVSVAASLLCYEMLQKPKSKPTLKPEEVLF